MMMMTLIASAPERHAEVCEDRTIITALFRELAADERGQDLIEYGLLCGFITVGVVLAATNLGTATNGIYGGIGTQMATIPWP